MEKFKDIAAYLLAEIGPKALSIGLILGVIFAFVLVIGMIFTGGGAETPFIGVLITGVIGLGIVLICASVVTIGIGIMKCYHWAVDRRKSKLNLIYQRKTPVNNKKYGHCPCTLCTATRGDLNKPLIKGPL